MKKPIVDYRTFRLKRINEPQFSHLKLLVGWLVYFLFYLLTENLIPMESCSVVHIRLDDLIPFCEWFIIPYVFWYLLIVISLGYFVLYNIDSFKKLSTYIIITQVVAMIVYIAFPNRQDLRPLEFPRDNIATRLLGLIYTLDTSSNVCPSLHVAYSLGIASTWLKVKDVSVWWKVFVVISVILICMSVTFIKQHSALDAILALPLGLFAEIVVFRKYWMEKFKKA